MSGNRRLAKRYAQALGELAVERAVIEQVQDDSDGLSGPFVPTTGYGRS